MKSKRYLYLRESFIHLKGLKTFVNLEGIEHLDYETDENNELVGVSIYFKSKDEPMLVFEAEDIANLAYYFFDFEQAKDEGDVKEEIDAIGDELANKVTSVLDENMEAKFQQLGEALASQIGQSIRGNVINKIIQELNNRLMEIQSILENFTKQSGE